MKEDSKEFYARRRTSYKIRKKPKDKIENHTYSKKLDQMSKEGFMRLLTTKTTTLEQLEMYNVYLQTKGNKPLLFGGGSIDGSPSTDLSGVDFVNGERPGNQNIVDIAKSQVGNVGGQPYWSWYGFDYRVEWCACFVSWCADQCGYIESGIIQKFAGCVDGSNWFKGNGQWQDRNYEPQAGDIIFFDWEGDGETDHVGIVEKCENGVVYTVEGNSGDACRQKQYTVGSSSIYGYGVPAY